MSKESPYALPPILVAGIVIAYLIFLAVLTILFAP